MVFCLLVAHRQLVAMVRMRDLDLNAADFNTIVNLIECHSSLKHGERWVPICLPQFNPESVWDFFILFILDLTSSLLYAHISYLWDGAGPCLIVLSISKNAFFELSKVRLKIEESFCTYRRYSELRSALLHPDSFSLKRLACEELWHFIYKGVSTSQVCCSSPQKPYIAYDERLSLYNGYFKVLSSNGKP